MADKKVPGVPSINGIQDPEIRRAMQSLVDGWRVRNGDSNDQGAQFITRDDLKGYLETGLWARGRNNLMGTTPDIPMTRGGIGVAFRALINNIIAEIQNSLLWKRLSSSIDKLDGPNGVLARIGLTETGLRQYINVTDTKIEAIDAILVKPDGTTLAAVVDERVAEVADSISRALSQTTLQTMANGGSVLAQQALLINQPYNIEDTIEASWNVKFDLDGYVVGAGLGVEGKGGTYTSQFLVRADRFAIGSPTTPDVFPFIVDTVNGSSVIAMNGQVYIGASTAEELATNASVPAINYIGAFATAPTTTLLKKNAVYKNTSDGNSYILLENGGAWGLYIEKGADGVAGTRGSVTRYASGSYWSDSTAFSAVGGTAVIGDTVTISDGSSFAQTRYWGGSAWLSPGVVIDGNLIVGGTLTASRLNSGNGSTGVAIAGAAAVTGPGGTSITNGAYIYQNSNTLYGLYCRNLYNSAVTGGGAAFFQSYGGYTVDAYNNALPGGNVTDVRAICGRSEYGVGVLGLTGSSNGIGVYGQGTGAGYAGYFNGNLHVSGNITCSGTYPGGAGGGVTSFNSRTGAVSLYSSDVTAALGYTPVSSSGSVNYASSAGFASASGGSMYLQNGSYTLVFQSSDNNMIYKNGGTSLWSAMTGWLSDERFKDVFGTTPGSGLAIVNALNVVDYSFKQDGPASDGGVKRTGFLAQQVAQVVPELVTDTGSSLLLNKVEIIPFLVKAIQELSAEVTALKAAHGN